MSVMLMGQYTAPAFAVSPPPELIRPFLEPVKNGINQAKPTEYLKKSGRLFLNAATAILNNKTLAATTAAAIASLYYLYFYPDKVAEFVERGTPLVGIGATMLVDRLLPRPTKPGYLPSRDVTQTAAKPVAPAIPSVPEPTLEQVWQETQPSLEKGWEATQSPQVKSSLQRQVDFEKSRRMARFKEYKRRQAEKREEKAFEEAWKESLKAKL